MKNAIEVRNLSKSYGDLKVVNDISFAVREGELFAFLGLNGAGKSTTVDCLSTLTKFDSGEIKLAGLNMKTQAQEIKQRIGIVFQEGLLDKRLTVLENLTLRAGFYYHSKAEVKAAVLETGHRLEVTATQAVNYVHVIRGEITIGEQTVKAGDALLFADNAVIEAKEDSQFIWFDLPKQ